MASRVRDRISVFILINVASPLCSQVTRTPQIDEHYGIQSTELNFPFASLTESDVAELAAFLSNRAVYKQSMYLLCIPAGIVCCESLINVQSL